MSSVILVNKTENIERLCPYIEGEMSFQVWIKTMTGDMFDIRVKLKETVWEMKRKIFKAKGGRFNPKLLRLVYGGQQMKDDKTLQNYKVVDQCTIHLVFSIGPSKCVNKIPNLYFVDPEEEPETMTIFIRTLTGKTLKIEGLTQYDSIEYIKNKIQNMEGIPPSSQRMIFAGRQVDNPMRLEDYGICDKNTLHLVLRLRGGDSKDDEKYISSGCGVELLNHGMKITPSVDWGKDVEKSQNYYGENPVMGCRYLVNPFMPVEMEFDLEEFLKSSIIVKRRLMKRLTTMSPTLDVEISPGTLISGMGSIFRIYEVGKEKVEDITNLKNYCDMERAKRKILEVIGLNLINEEGNNAERTAKISFLPKEGYFKGGTRYICSLMDSKASGIRWSFVTAEVDMEAIKMDLRKRCEFLKSLCREDRKEFTLKFKSDERICAFKSFLLL